MTPKLILIAGALGALAACQPAIPESGAQPGVPGRGVGFDRSEQAKTQVAQQQVPAAQPVQSQPLPAAQPAPAQDPVITAAQNALNAPAPASRPVTAPVSQPVSQQPRIAGVTPNELENSRATQANSGQQVVIASPSNAAPTLVSNPGLSDENDFDAVSSRQSIESDAARIEANRARYTVVQPTALPSRDGTAQPNVVAFALQSDHPKGTQLFRRIGFNAAAKFQKNCAVFNSADDAQLDFLTRGGPAKDRKGLDPDGDGYACNWDPAPYRSAAGN